MAAAIPAGPAPIIPTDCFISFNGFIGSTQPFSHAVLVINFSTAPIVTVPCPDCSITQLPSHNRKI